MVLYYSIYYFIILCYSFGVKMQPATASGWWKTWFTSLCNARWPGRWCLAHEDRIRGAGSCSDFNMACVMFVQTHGLEFDFDQEKNNPSAIYKHLDFRFESDVNLPLW